MTAAGAGAFGTNSRVALTQIRDGTSNTLAIGESKQDHVEGSSPPNPRVFGPFWGAGIHAAVHGRSDAAASGIFAINYPYGASQGGIGENAYLQYPWGFGSWHPSGANFLYCDGSVRFLPDNISLSIFTALGTANGGETNIGAAP